MREQATGLDALAPTKRWTLEQLGVAETAAARLETEMRASTVALERHRVQGRKVRFCVDLDVLMSATSKATERERLSFWSKLFLEVKGAEFVLLPGTVIELLEHTEKQLVRPAARTPLAAALLDSFHGLKFDQVSVSSHYNQFLDSLRTSGNDASRTLLSKIVSDKCHIIGHDELVEFDHEVFYKSIVHLSHGARSSQFRNNRVDAYNLALVKALNAMPSDHYYIIVSNTAAMENLDRAVIQQSFHSEQSPFEEQIEKSMVWKPSRSFVYGVLNSCQPTTDGVALGWKLVQNLSGFRSELSSERFARSANRHTEPQPDLFDAASTHATQQDPDETMVRLLASVEVLQVSVGEIVRRVETSKVSVLSELINYDTRFQDLKKRLRQVIKRIPDVASSVKLFPSRQAVLRLGDIEDVTEFHRSSTIINQSTGAVVAGCYNVGGNVGIYFPSRANLEKTLAVFNFARQQVVVLAQSGKLEGTEKIASGIVVVDESGREEMPFAEVELPISLFGLNDALRKRAGRILGQVRFLRVNTHWFDISFERVGDATFIGIASHLPIGESIASFVNELISTSARSEGFVKVFNDVRAFVSADYANLEEAAG